LWSNGFGLLSSYVPPKGRRDHPEKSLFLGGSCLYPLWSDSIRSFHIQYLRVLKTLKKRRSQKATGVPWSGDEYSAGRSRDSRRHLRAHRTVANFGESESWSWAKAKRESQKRCPGLVDVFTFPAEKTFSPPDPRKLSGLMPVSPSLFFALPSTFQPARRYVGYTLSFLALCPGP